MLRVICYHSEYTYEGKWNTIWMYRPYSCYSFFPRWHLFVKILSDLSGNLYANFSGKSLSRGYIECLFRAPIYQWVLSHYFVVHWVHRKDNLEFIKETIVSKRRQFFSVSNMSGCPPPTATAGTSRRSGRPCAVRRCGPTHETRHRLPPPSDRRRRDLWIRLVGWWQICSFYCRKRGIDHRRSVI